jgi:hypothetical protein
MTSPIPSLLNTGDLDAFQSSDPEFFTNAAGETIRNFCQWHIFPSITVTETVPIKPDGTIMLPTLYLTDVASVVINGLTQDPSAYEWHPSGFVRRFRKDYFEWPLWPLESEQPFREYPSPVARWADVTYTHGYDEIPPAVNVVGLELTSRAMELPAGVATEITAGPQSIRFGALGIVLTDDQRRRLGPYALVRF